MAGQEKVYLSVETAGIDAAVKNLKEIVGPLQEINGLFSGLSAGGGKISLDNSQFAALKDSLDDIVEAIDQINARMRRAAFFNLITKGAGLISPFANSLSKSAVLATALGSAMETVGVKSGKALTITEIRTKAISTQIAAVRAQLAALNTSRLMALSSGGIGGLNLSGLQMNGAKNAVQSVQQSLQQLMPVTKGISSGFSAVAKSAASSGMAFAAAHKGALLLGGGLGAAALAAAALVKSNIEDEKAFAMLNPEIETCTSVLADSRKETEALNLAFSATSGKFINDMFLPAFKAVTTEVDNATLSIKKWWSMLVNGDLVASFKKLGQDLKGFGATVAGTTEQALSSFYQFFGGSKNNVFERAANSLAEIDHNADAAGDKIFEASETGKVFADQLDKARKHLQKTKEEANGTAAGIDKAKQATDEWLVAMQKVQNLFQEWEMDSNGNFWIKSLAQRREETERYYTEQLKLLRQVAGDEESKTRASIELYKEKAQKLLDIDLENATKTGNYQLLAANKVKLAEEAIAAERAAEDQRRLEEVQKAKAAAEAEEQRRFEELQKQKQAAEEARLAKIRELEEAQQAAMNQFLSGVQGSISGTLTSSLTSMFDSAEEGTFSLRESSYELFHSLAKNIFSTSLTQAINSVVAMAMNAGNSAAQVPVIGPALAAAAVSGTLAMGMAIAKRNITTNPQIQYATGGYISQGLVRGAGGYGDSVSALLQPGERVLSKEETKAYDSTANKQPSNIVINVNVSGQLSTPSAVAQTVRTTLIPEIRRAVAAGYAL